jgi:predicted HTH domain antitoxin
MSTTISIELPCDILHASRMTTDELRRELALTLFAQGRISFGKAREVAGLSVATFQQLLGSRGINVHYDVDDYREDMSTLQAQGRI